MELSKTAVKFLMKAGWKKGRKIDISEYAAALEKEGYTVHEKAREFMEEFAGLVGEQPAFRVPNVIQKIHFDPILASERMFFGNMSFYEARVGEPLVVIGEAFNEHYTLMMAESGKVYGAYDTYMAIEGKDYIEGLNSLYNCIRTPEIPRLSEASSAVLSKEPAQFCDAAVKFLKEAGWAPGYKKDISVYARVLEKKGCKIHQEAKKFLEEFAGLVGDQPSYKPPGKLDKIHFDPLPAFNRMEHGELQSYEIKAGEELVVIGEAYNGQYTLMMAESGKVYGSFNHHLTLFGYNYIEALSSIYNGIKTL